MELTISRHCVPTDPETGLSPLQQALLTDPHRVRIAAAPTGAGKSYAFQRALTQDRRVLFIVPTRRLAQNLAAGIIHDLMENTGWPPAKAEAKVALWSSDQSARLREQGVVQIGGYRLRQLQALDDTREGGEIIVAIPEVLSHLLLQRRIETGQAGLGIFDVLDAFEHIVFDEFHTIEARGFGLAALCARLVSVVTAEGARFGRAKVSLLSATPLAIRPVLDKLGIAATDIAELQETVGASGRALHGDVVLSFSQAPSLAELVAEQRAVVAAEVEAGRQVVLIYNALADLIRELPALATTLEQVGIPRDQVLVINSIYDSGREGRITAGFQAGRWQNPDRFSVLIATASVEVGVTFRAANVLLMEPGFQPLNFLQRYGRAARRGADGHVWVRIDEALTNRNPWLRELLDWAQAHQGQQVGIEALTAVLSRSTQEAFQDSGAEQPRYFGRLSNRAIYTAGLYWNALIAHKSNRGPRHEHLLAHRPASARQIYALLQQVRSMEKDRLYAAAARKWCDRFEKQAYTLRDIGRRIRVVQTDGGPVEVDQVWLERETTALERGLHRPGADGKDEIHITGELDDYLREEKQYLVKRMVTVYFPHTEHSASLPATVELVDAWCRELNDRNSIEGMAWEDYPDAMAAAEKLVRMTGLVPSDDEDISLAASSGVL